MLIFFSPMDTLQVAPDRRLSHERRSATFARNSTGTVQQAIRSQSCHNQKSWMAQFSTYLYNDAKEEMGRMSKWLKESFITQMPASRRIRTLTR
jgi:hypothetical protein